MGKIGEKKPTWPPLAVIIRKWFQSCQKSSFLASGAVMMFRFLICPCRITLLEGKICQISSSFRRKIRRQEIQEGSVPRCGTIGELPHDARTQQRRKLMTVRIVKHSFEIIHLL